MPDWQLEPDEEMWGTPYDENMIGPVLVDENGMPIGTQPADPLAPGGAYPAPDQRTPDQTELDRIFNSPPPPPQRVPVAPREQPARTQQPRSEPAPDPLQPR